MIISRNWLKNYISINVIDKELSSLLSSSGSEVEDYYQIRYENIVTAVILDIKKCKKCDNLFYVTVSDGVKRFNVVCGANNISISDIVPLAKENAIVSERIIKNRKIRDYLSEGMLCSGKELGINDDSNGIYKFEKTMKPGVSLAEIFENDTIFKIDITPNRGDCLSHLGIARELSVIFNQKISKKPISFSKAVSNISQKINLKIDNVSDCPHYYLRMIENVKIGSSPDWLVNDLKKMGCKSVNNVVDITNYIMYDLGQPLHAFDYDKIKSKEIVVKKATKNSSFMSLDGSNRILSEDDLVICDKDNPIALAGIIGGKNSQISNTTTNILIESAVFNRKTIRKSVKNLNINTEASYRFERGIDYKNCQFALDKAVFMIKKYASGDILGGICSNDQEEKEQLVEICHKNIRNYLNLQISDDQINQILIKLGFVIRDDICVVPSFRHDIESWHDLCEEVGRIFGYEKVKDIKLNKKVKISYGFYEILENIKDFMVNEGFCEVYSYSFFSKQDAKLHAILSNDLLEIKNPIQPENKYMRHSLIPGLLKSISHNLSFDPILVFEIGRVFVERKEITRLCFAICDKKNHTKYDDIINKFNKKYSIGKDKFMVFNYSSKELKKYKIKRDKLTVVEVDLSSTLKKKHPDNLYRYKISDDNIRYRSISKFPSINRDISIIVDKNVNKKEIENSIYTVSPLINRVEIFDCFVSDKFGKNKQSLAYHINFQDKEKTLSSKEGNEVFENIVANLKSKYKAKLRTK